MNDYISHLADDDGINTACGEDWQGWQAPEKWYDADPDARARAPFSKPRSHVDSIHLCGACSKIVRNYVAPVSKETE